MAGERKLAGLLAEAELPAVVVGIGLNVNWPTELPAELSGTATALNHLAGRHVDREALLERFLASLGARVSDWQAVDGDYRRGCDTVGRTVRVELIGGVVTGTAVDVTAEGHLLVDTGGGLHAIAAGDVVHLR